MPRPERMESALADWSPVGPPKEAEVVAQQPSAGATGQPDTTKWKRSFYLYRATVDDLLNAAEALSATPGAPRGPSDLVNAAVEEYLETLRNRFNDGEPFLQRTGPLARGPRIR